MALSSIEREIRAQLEPLYGDLDVQTLMTRWWDNADASTRRAGMNPSWWRVPAALQDAVFWIDATRSDVAGGYITNLGTAGSALDARFGTGTGVDASDPTLLLHDGVSYVYYPGGSTSNVMSVPDAAALDITGDIEIVVRVALDDWTPSTVMGLVDRDNGDPNRAFGFSVNTTGGLRFRWYPTGSAASSIIANSTVSLGAADGATKWVKVTLDVNDGGVYKVNFYHADDSPTEPSSWTQLGTTITGGSTTSLPAVTAGMAFGGAASGFLTGKYYRGIVRNGIGGSTVVDVDTSVITSGAATSFTAATGQTVTLGRATSGRKSVAVVRNVLLFGTDDYLEAPDNAALNFAAGAPFSVIAVVRRWGTPGSNQYIGGKRDAAGAYYQLGWNSSAKQFFQISDGTVTPSDDSTASFTSGAAYVAAGVRDVVSDKLFSYIGTTVDAGTADSTTGAISDTAALGIGRSNTTYGDMELFAFAVVPRLITADEIAAVGGFYGVST